MANANPPGQVWLTHRPGQHAMERTSSNDPGAVRYVLWDEHSELLDYVQRMTARDETDPVSVLVELRFALGDNGARSIPELIAYARELATRRTPATEKGAP